MYWCVTCWVVIPGVVPDTCRDHYTLWVIPAPCMRSEWSGHVYLPYSVSELGPARLTNGFNNVTLDELLKIRKHYSVDSIKNLMDRVPIADSAFKSLLHFARDCAKVQVYRVTDHYAFFLDMIAYIAVLKNNNVGISFPLVRKAIVSDIFKHLETNPKFTFQLLCRVNMPTIDEKICHLRQMRLNYCIVCTKFVTEITCHHCAVYVDHKLHTSLLRSDGSSYNISRKSLETETICQGGIVETLEYMHQKSSIMQ